MSNYSKTTDFEAKDSLPTGDSGKIIRGAEFETEFDAISTAIATKADTAGPTFTGTLTFETISDGTIGVTAFVDEDNMASNSATLVPTQQSVKAYVDSQVTAQDLDFQADTGGALSIDLDSETMTFTGGTGIDTSGLGNAVTFAIDSTVATLTGTQTLTNKTLTSPDVNTPDIDGGTIDGTVIGGTTPAAVSATTVSATGNITVGGTVDGRDVATDGTKLDGIEAGATADQTAAEIRTLVEAATDSNVFTDADHTKLDGIEAGATGDQTNAEIRAAVEAATDSNVFTDADHSKLDGIEALADVTDTTNVTAAGALMDSELTNITAVKALNQGVATTDTPTFAGLATSANVTFGDNDKAVFGAGSDLQIYHTGSHSFVQDTGSGDLYLATNGDKIILRNTTLGESFFEGTSNGDAKIFYNGLEKLATTSTGIDVTGTVTADGLTVDSTLATIGSGGTTNQATELRLEGTSNAGNGAYLRGRRGGSSSFLIGDTAGALGSGTGVINYVYGSNPWTVYTNGDERLTVNGNGDISFYEDTGTTAKLFWDSSAESLGIGTTSPAAEIEISNTGSPQLRVTDTTNTVTSKVMSDTSFGYVGTQTNHGFNILVNNQIKTAFDTSGNVGIGTSSPNSYANFTTLTLDGTNGSEIDLEAAGTLRGQLYSTTSAVGLQTSSATNLPLVLGTNGTEAMRIDSSGNVGIGTSSVSTSKLHVQGTTGIASAVRVESTAADSDAYYIADNDASAWTWGIDGGASDSWILSNAFGLGAPKMTVTTGGNLLVGKTSPTSATDGAELKNGNGVSAIIGTSDQSNAASGNVMILNRRTTDGTIVDFRKDGVSVGSIGTRSSGLVVGSGDTGLFYDGGGDRIFPESPSGGAARDAAIDLGTSAARFKDLYLSGGAYIGGTAAANKLDDYEEGTFTPELADALTGGNTATVASAAGFYTKVGNIVHVTIRAINITTTGMTSGNDLFIRDLPFTSNGTVNSMGAIQISEISFDGTPVLYASGGTTIAKIGESVSGSVVDFVTVGQLTSGNADIQAHVTYRVG